MNVKSAKQTIFWLLRKVVTCYKSIARMGMLNVGSTMGLFTRSVLSMPSGKILDKKCESLYC